jgi:hypothetical protein
MKPIYFPFSFISKIMVDFITVFFNEVIVYLPCRQGIYPEMQAESDKGRLDIRIPIASDEATLEKMINAFRQWRDVNRGTAIDFLKTRKDAVPFFDDLSVAQIRADIKKQCRKDQFLEDPSMIKEQNLEFADRIFLRLAQEFDFQSISLAQDLTAFQAMQKEMIRQLKGEDEPSDIKGGDQKQAVCDDLGTHMTQERMAAWTRLFLHDPAKSPLLITGSRAVVNYLLEKNPKIQPLAHFYAIPVSFGRIQDERVQKWRDSLYAKLSAYVNSTGQEPPNELGPVPDVDLAQGSATVNISFYLAPEMGPEKLMRPFLVDALPRPSGKDTPVGYKNSIIGLIEA